jgi:hypothetical protein
VFATFTCQFRPKLTSRIFRFGPICFLFAREGDFPGYPALYRTNSLPKPLSFIVKPSEPRLFRGVLDAHDHGIDNMLRLLFLWKVTCHPVSQEAETRLFTEEQQAIWALQGHAQRSTMQVCRQLQRRVRFERRSSCPWWLSRRFECRAVLERQNALALQSKRFTCADIPPGVS